ncbi:polysaccharide deacetylase family protein [Ramlibacter tataouinensis]|uniref:polysaccharide deacetylase family protein n=1 Tax=Ramlibacter tataouinensis TaxID=94132 RepID=UPI001D037903|nr:polysaccharide deacetylase family protein [Ramlibacter tataouinensis]
MKSAIFTLDLEDHVGRYDTSSRYPSISRQVLQTLAQNGIVGTVFVVGKIAKAEPALLREISDLGHELACHSLDHTPLDKQAPAAFREDTARAKHLIENCIGKAVVGFRAPVFSLTKSTLWAVDVLAELGFQYSSSVMPTHNPLYGFPQAPTKPFLWKNGLVEIPCPVGKLGPITLPYLGGFYLRYLPQILVRSLITQADPESCLWTYCHPYDFDTAEPFNRIQGAPLWTSILLWFNRRDTLPKILAVVRENSSSTLRGWVEANSACLPRYLP